MQISKTITPQISKNFNYEFDLYYNMKTACSVVALINVHKIVTRTKISHNLHKKLLNHVTIFRKKLTDDRVSNVLSKSSFHSHSVDRRHCVEYKIPFFRFNLHLITCCVVLMLQIAERKSSIALTGTMKSLKSQLNFCSFSEFVKHTLVPFSLDTSSHVWT